MPSSHDFHKVAALFKQTRASIGEASKSAMLECGVQVLHWTRVDYSDRSEGKSGNWLNMPPWLPISEATKRRKGSDAIGVDTGRLVGSVQFGFGIFPQTGDPAVGAAGEQVMEATETSILVGTVVKYAAKFDAVRPIFPDTLPPARVKDLEETVMERMDDAFGPIRGY